MVSAADVPEGGSRPDRASAFHHEALVYSGDGGFLEGTLPFIRAAVERGEQVLVTVDGRKIALLRDQLGGVGEQVTYADGGDRPQPLPAHRVAGGQRRASRSRYVAASGLAAGQTLTRMKAAGAPADIAE